MTTTQSSRLAVLRTADQTADEFNIEPLSQSLVTRSTVV